MFCLVEMNTNRIDKQSIEEATREAEQRALDFNPAERANLIRRMLIEIPLAINAGMTAEEPPVNPKYIEIKEFAERYPELFKKIVGQQDLTPIRSMLAMLDKMAEGSISTHQASVIIGQKLVDRYVKPQLKGHGKGGRGH